MGKPIYNTALHKAERKRWAPVVAAGQAHCTELVCKMPSRWIPPGPWQLAHDRRVHTGPHTCTPACYLGPAHVRCNTAEGGRERHHRAKTRRRWRL